MEMIHVMKGAQKAMPTYCAAMKLPVAMPRSWAGNQAVTTRPLAGKAGASKNPTAMRAKISSVKVALKPMQMVNTDHPASEIP